LGKYQGWQEALRQYAQYEKADMTFDEGETLAAVVEIKKGKYFGIDHGAGHPGNVMARERCPKYLKIRGKRHSARIIGSQKWPAR
jgi:hypothetical protein